MLNDIFKAVVIASCVGAALTLIITLLKPLTKRFFSARWQYYIWLTVLAVMCVPLKFNIPTGAIAVMPNRVKNLMKVGQSVLIPVAKTEVFRIGTAEIWLAGVLVVLSVKLVSYWAFLYKIRKSGEKIVCPELEKLTERKITVIKSDETISPLMAGIFKPVLIFPKTEMTAEQKRYVLVHELMHFKRKDIFYKWLVGLVKCLHWFNPAIYFVSRQIDVECEISCDLAATEHMTKEEKRAYVDTILVLVSAGAKKMPLTTGMAASRGVLKRRIRSIATMRKNSRFIKIFSTSLAAACLIGTMLVSGTAAGLMVNEIEQRLILSGKMPVIEFEVSPKSDKQVKFVQTDYIEQPMELSQTIEDIPRLPEQPALTEISTPSEETETALFEEEPAQELLEEATEERQVLEEEVMEEEEESGLSWTAFEKPENAKVIKYSSDDNTTHYITLQPDENGLISVYFESNVQNAPATVNIYDSQRPGKGWGYQLPTDGQTAYEFDGFDPEKSYTVEINSYCPGNYGIEGKAYVY